MNANQFVMAGLALALIVGVTAVFLASGDPDGLESTAFYVQGEKSLTGPSPEEGDAEAIGAGTFEYEAPMPDYAMGDSLGSIGQIIAIVVGIFIAFIIGYGISTIMTTVKG
jgi:cobalt/nickel transport protein